MHMVPPDDQFLNQSKLGHLNLHWFNIRTWGGPICIGSKVGHQVASLHCHIALDCPIGIMTKLHNLHCITFIATLPWIALLTSSVSIELVSSSARVTSVKSATRSLTQWETTGPIDRTPETPGSDKKRSTWNSIGKYKRNKKHSKWKCNIKVSKWNWSLTKIQNKMKRHLVYERDLKFQNQNVIGQ